MADLVLNTMVLQLATEGLNTEVHWPGGASGVTIGPGFDIGASKVKPGDLRTILSKIGMASSSIELLVLTTVEKAGARATGEAAKALMQELQLKSKVKLTMQQSLDLGYIVKNRPGSSFQAVTDSGFCMSSKLLHPAYREALVKITYGTPALTMKLGAKYDAELSRTSDYLKQGEILLRMFAELKKEKEEQMKVLTKGTSEWLSARVHRDSAHGMGYFIGQVVKTLQSGGKVIIENKPLTVAELAAAGNPTAEMMARVGVVTYELNNNVNDSNREATVKYALNQHKTRAQNSLQSEAQGSKVNEAFLKEIAATLPQQAVFRSPESKKMQIILKELGFYSGSIDGDFGQGSNAALEQYRKSKNLANAQAAKAQLLKDYDAKYPPVQPNPNQQNNPQNNNSGNAGSGSWWDQVSEMYEAAKRDAQLTSRSWFAKIKELYEGGMVAFGRAIFGGTGITTIIGQAYESFKQYLQQQQQQQNQQNQNNNDSGNDTLKELQAAFGGKGSISGKVGAGGDNKAKDVLVVRGLLFRAGYLSETIQQVLGTAEARQRYSKSDSALEAAIRKYQSEKVGLTNPDGRIDPGGRTLNALNGIATNQNKPANNTTNHQPTEPAFSPASLDASVFPCFN